MGCVASLHDGPLRYLDSLNVSAERSKRVLKSLVAPVDKVNVAHDGFAFCGKASKNERGPRT